MTLSFIDFILLESEVVDTSDWMQISDEKGSNRGGIHLHPETGEDHYVKYYERDNQAKEEVAAHRIFHALGAKSLEANVATDGVEKGVITKYDHSLNTIPHDDFIKHIDEKTAPQFVKMYHAASLVKDWDFCGMSYDNIHKDSSGDLVSIDHGGSMNHNAMGGKKEFGIDGNAELLSFKNRGKAAPVLKHIEQNHPEAMHSGLEELKNLNRDHVESIFKSVGHPKYKQMTDTIMGRRASILNHYGVNHETETEGDRTLS